MPHTTPHRDRPRALGITIGLAFGAFVIGNIVILTVAILLEAVGIPILDQPARVLFLSVILLQGVTFGGVALAYLWLRDLGLEFIRMRIPTLQDIVVTIGGLLTLLGLLFVASTILSYFGIQSAQNQVIEIGNQNPIVFLVLVPLSFLLIGPGEELLFRGLVQGTLRESFHPVQAIVLASTIFAIVHFFSLSGQGKLVYIGIVFTLALVLGSTYEYSDNLIVPAFIHGAYNAVQFGGAYLAATGML